MRGAALACVLFGLSGQAWADERRYAVVVGANTGVADDEPLLYAERDAERVAQVLSALGGVHAGDVALLRGADADALRDALQRFERRIEQDTQPGDSSLLFFYYSGHADSDALHLRGTRMPLDELSAALEGSTANLRVMVLDACRSGELTRSKGGAPAEPFEIQARELLTSDGTAILASSSQGEDAQESERLRGGVFTHHLLTGLQGAADSSGDGRVTLDEAYSYGYTHTIRTTSGASAIQHPSYAFNIRGRNDLVLTDLGSAQMGRLLLEDPGLYVLFEQGPAGRVAAEVSAEAGTLLAVPPGRYLLRRRGADQVHEGELSVRSGESLVVETAQLRELPYGRTVRKGYATERRAALGLTAGAGVAGPSLPGVGFTPVGGLGARVDLEHFSLVGRARGAWYRSSNDDLVATHQLLGGELTVMRLVDLGPVSPGLGVRVGLDGVRQTFDTRGNAEPRLGWMGRTGSMLRVEVAPRPRLLVGLEVGADVALYPHLNPDDGLSSLKTQVVPHVAIDLTTFR